MKHTVTFLTFAILILLLGSFKKARFVKIPAYLKDILKETLKVAFILYLSLFIGNIFSGKYHIRTKTDVTSGAKCDKALMFITTSGLKGNIFNNYESGSYLIWKLYPKYKVFIDERLPPYGKRFIKDIYLASLHNPLAFESIVKRYGINFVFLEYSLNMDSFAELITHLYYSKEWALVFFDDVACVFVRDIGQNSNIIGKFRVELEKKDDSGLFVSADVDKIIDRGLFYERIGLLDNAVKLLERAEKIRPDHRDIHYNLGTLYLKKGMYECSIREFKENIKLDTRDIDAYNNLGVSYANIGRFKEATEEFKKALWLKPWHRLARKNLEMAIKDYEKQKYLQRYR